MIRDYRIARGAEMYGVPESEVTKDMRRRAKALNYHTLYGDVLNEWFADVIAPIIGAAALTAAEQALKRLDYYAPTPRRRKVSKPLPSANKRAKVKAARKQRNKK